ncbi:MAG: ATP-binding protein [Candidatus Symbiothrix sp.]|nr:ATP-binding protein [Candidatus Symbiothrix sp.]
MQKLDIPEKVNVAENQQVETTLQKKLNLFEHFEQIIALSENLGLNDEFFKQAKWHIEVVKDVLNINDMQAVLFAHFVGSSENISLKDLATSTKCSQIRLLQYMSDIDELEKRRMIRRNGYGNRHGFYRVPLDVIDAVRNNKEYLSASRQNLSIGALFSVLNQLFNEWFHKGDLTFDLFVYETNVLFAYNSQLGFAQKLKQYDLDDDNRVLLLRFCNLFVENEDEKIHFQDIRSCFDEMSFHMESSLKNKTNRLFQEGLIECNNDNGFEDRESFRLTDKAKTELLGELNFKQKQAQKDLTLHTSFSDKRLYYNEKEQRQILELTALLQEENFAKVKQRLSDKGMRTGFACLFHGAPGTGKTETVYQIARQTERNIYQVDISETKSMWFGESEKRIKGIFSKYRELVKTEKIAPILFFNEADAVIGKRKDVTSGNVAQTENAIQNIILQEMETLDGIMIATTNLTQNMDKAFERRFLYKIEFSKPSIDAKRSIWQSIIPELSEKDATTLAIRYDFSGGQIENIARKATIDSIIVGKDPDLTKLEFHCKNELLTNGRRAIGFCAA